MNVTNFHCIHRFRWYVSCKYIFKHLVVVMKSINFWDTTPCSTLSVNRCSSETSVVTQRTTRRYIPEFGTLHMHFCSCSFFYQAHCDLFVLINISKFYKIRSIACTTMVATRIFSKGGSHKLAISHLSRLKYFY
jgi:hypothetical protein